MKSFFLNLPAVNCCLSENPSWPLAHPRQYLPCTHFSPGPSSEQIALRNYPLGAFVPSVFKVDFFTYNTSVHIKSSLQIEFLQSTWHFYICTWWLQTGNAVNSYGRQNQPLVPPASINIHRPHVLFTTRTQIWTFGLEFFPNIEGDTSRGFCFF